MKRFLCLLLCVVMATALLAGCGEDDEDKGAIIPVYLASPIGNFDPAYATHDVNGNIFLGMMFEGLFRIGTNGKLEKAIAKSWTVKEDPDHDDYVMEIELNTTYWSDGRQVSADDFVYAWKRLLEPEYQSENASLLFDINPHSISTAGFSMFFIIYIELYAFLFSRLFSPSSLFRKFFLNISAKSLL